MTILFLYTKNLDNSSLIFIHSVCWKKIMKYERIWNAIDKIAKQNGLSLSGLAKKSGLDPTAFNKSKRIRADGKKRWPSLESLSKVLSTCHMDFVDFCCLIENDPIRWPCTLPYIFLSSMCQQDCNCFDFSSWGKIDSPSFSENTYLINLDSHSFEPIYSCGSILILEKYSEIRQKDRVLILLKSGTVLIKEFLFRSENVITVSSLSKHSHISEIEVNSIKLLNRIIWASQ